MYEQVATSFEGELWGRSSNISLGIPIRLDRPVETSDQHEMSNVKFSVFVQQRLLDVFLDDECSGSSIVAFLSSFESDMDIVKWITDADAIASVAVFTRFDNPHIFLISFFLHAFEFVVVTQEMLVLWVIHALNKVKRQR